MKGSINDMFQSISPNELNQLIASGKEIELIDVRTPVEYRSMHVAIARNEPLDRLDPKAIHAGRNGQSHEPLYVICRSGSRSRQACQQFFASGFTNVINVEGGTLACAKEGVPVIRGQKAMPLNCQVQIITGLLVLAGSILAGLSGNLSWLALPIVMGAGLAFSGATNTCAMGWFLAKMPWNQIKENAQSNQSSIASCGTKSGGSCG
jgi:rhodanese-related sulfurtransferase